MSFAGWVAAVRPPVLGDDMVGQRVLMSSSSEKADMERTDGTGCSANIIRWLHKGKVKGDNGVVWRIWNQFVMRARASTTSMKRANPSTVTKAKTLSGQARQASGGIT